jgi:hypothetical protein
MELLNKKKRKKGRKTDYGNEDVNLRSVLGTSIRISSQRTAIRGTGGAGVTGDRKPATSGTGELAPCTAVRGEGEDDDDEEEEEEDEEDEGEIVVVAAQKPKEIYHTTEDHCKSFPQRLLEPQKMRVI